MSYGQTLLKEILRFYIDEEPLVNYRPDWLHGLEIDLFFKDNRMAFEYNGDQHYYFDTDYTPTVDELKRIIERDYVKMRIIRDRKIKLYKLPCNNLYQSYFNNTLFYKQSPVELPKELRKKLREYRKIMVNKRKELQFKHELEGRDIDYFKRLRTETQVNARRSGMITARQNYSLF